MDAWLPRLRAAFILVAMWASFLLTNLAPPGSEALTMALALCGYLAGYIMYPIAIVLGSRAVAATRAQRQLASVSVVLFVLLMLSRPYDLSPRDRVSSVLALAALISLWHSFIAALTAAERRTRLRERAGLRGLWMAALFFPFLGVFYVHRRYRALVSSGGDR